MGILNDSQRIDTYEGKVIGYMDCAVLSYTEDPGLYLTGVKFNLQGRRITGYSYDDLILNFFENEEEVKEYLPAELHPKEED